MSLTKRWIEDQMVNNGKEWSWMDSAEKAYGEEFDDADATIDDDEARHYEEQKRKTTDDRNNGDGYVDYTEDE